MSEQTLTKHSLNCLAARINAGTSTSTGSWEDGIVAVKDLTCTFFYEGVGVVGIVYSGATCISCFVELLDCPTKLNSESQKYLKMSSLNYSIVRSSQSQLFHTPMFPPVLRNVKVIKITFKCQLTMGNTIPETAPPPTHYSVRSLNRTNFFHYWNPL